MKSGPAIQLSNPDGCAPEPLSSSRTDCDRNHLLEGLDIDSSLTNTESHQQSNFRNSITPSTGLAPLAGKEMNSSGASAPAGSDARPHTNTPQAGKWESGALICSKESESRSNPSHATLHNAHMTASGGADESNQHGSPLASRNASIGVERRAGKNLFRVQIFRKDACSPVKVRQQGNDSSLQGTVANCSVKNNIAVPLSGRSAHPKVHESNTGGNLTQKQLCEGAVAPKSSSIVALTRDPQPSAVTGVVVEAHNKVPSPANKTKSSNLGRRPVSSSNDAGSPAAGYGGVNSMRLAVAGSSAAALQSPSRTGIKPPVTTTATVMQELRGVNQQQAFMTNSVREACQVMSCALQASGCYQPAVVCCC